MNVFDYLRAKGILQDVMIPAMDLTPKYGEMYPSPEGAEKGQVVAIRLTELLEEYSKLNSNKDYEALGIMHRMSNEVGRLANGISVMTLQHSKNRKTWQRGQKRSRTRYSRMR